MSIVLHLSATIKLLLVFVLVLIAIRRNLSLGNAFLLGSIVLGLLFGLGAMPMAESMVSSVLYPKTLMLSFIVSLILVLSSSMETSGHMRRLLGSFKGLVRNSRLNLIIFPALIGLLPMPGGAVFSAPMVKELGADTSLHPDHLSYINYWFRHIWEYWWPLYPGILLAVTMADVHLWAFVLFLCPLTFVAVGIGYQPIKKFHNNTENNEKNNRPPVKPFLKELSPILIVILLGLSIGEVFSYLYQEISISKEIGLFIALCISILWVWKANAMSSSEIFSVVANRRLLGMVYMVFAILIFKGILEDSHAVEAISAELANMHVPVWMITIALPFLVGGVVGITVAFVGSTFPILIALITSFNLDQFLLPYLMLALVSGFVGVLLSPLHLCLLLSNKFFNARLGKVYSHLWMPAAAVLVSGIVYFWISRIVIQALMN
jgi:integral membrane protein (TIGR00529 family)